ncbi:MAG: dinitrogenase iron-molybdenum cofactor [Planctomycetota bacterium]|nr:MAG: dinitrogenase iron-molybdenum cofactor [Planctomycetota bacterium]
MKVAVAADGDVVSSHFGRCEKFRFYEVEGGEARFVGEEVPPPHAPGLLPSLMKERGVDVVICGGMGPRAVAFFEQLGIRVYTGVSGNVQEAVEALAKGTLTTGDSTCDHNGFGPCPRH